MAHVLHIDFFKALDLPEASLVILSNEATRQRAIDAQYYALVQSTNSRDIMERTLKIHGPYTEGFYDSELSALKEHLNRGK